MRRNQGFTILELMIVIAIVAIIVAIALPGLVGARKSANETSAVGFLKAIHSAQEMHRIRYSAYATSDEQLIRHGLLGASGEHTPEGWSGTQAASNGYYFEISNPTGSVWAARAFPSEPGATGDRWFYIDSSGVIRQGNGPAVGPASAPIGNGAPAGGN